EEEKRGAREDKEPDRPKRAPALDGSLRDRIDEDDEPSGHRDRAGDVVVVDDIVVTAFADVEGRQEQDDGRDRDVDPEDPLPTEVLRRHAPHRAARRSTAAADGAPRAERLVSLAALRE